MFEDADYTEPVKVDFAGPNNDGELLMVPVTASIYKGDH